MNNRTEKMMMLAATAVVSMAAGLLVGCMKERMKINSCCCIDEMQTYYLGLFLREIAMRIEKLKEIVLFLIAVILTIFIVKYF